MRNIKVTNTNGNSANGIRGSRVSVYNKEGLVGSMEVPAKFGGINYLKERKDFSEGTYLKEFSNIVEDAVGGCTHVEVLGLLERL
jgi:hypothetical protein